MRKSQKHDKALASLFLGQQTLLEQMREDRAHNDYQFAYIFNKTGMMLFVPMPPSTQPLSHFPRPMLCDDHSQKSSREMHQETGVGNKEVQENSEVAHTEGNLVLMVEPNTTAIANKEVDLNNKLPHTQESHAPAMKPNTSKVESKQVQVNSEVPHTEVSEDPTMMPHTTVVEPNGEQVIDEVCIEGSEADKVCQFEDYNFSDGHFVLLYSQFL